MGLPGVWPGVSGVLRPFSVCVWDVCAYIMAGAGYNGVAAGEVGEARIVAAEGGDCRLTIV